MQGALEDGGQRWCAANVCCGFGGAACISQVKSPLVAHPSYLSTLQLDARLPSLGQLRFCFRFPSIPCLHLSSSTSPLLNLNTTTSTIPFSLLILPPQLLSLHSCLQPICLVISPLRSFFELIVCSKFPSLSRSLEACFPSLHCIIPPSSPINFHLFLSLDASKPQTLPYIPWQNVSTPSSPSPVHPQPRPPTRQQQLETTLASFLRHASRQ